jgi:DNA-binding GntR family transcriptional regulator
MTRGVSGPVDGFDTTTLRGRVYQHLREGILSNRIAPGTVLQEVPLAESLGVSRGPIREALGDLAAEGLVTITPRRGAVVTSLSKRDFLEAYQVREVLESLAVQLAVPVMTEDAFGELERLQERMIEANDRNDFLGFFDANIEFHDSWVMAAGNGKLLDVYRRLIGQMVPYRRPSALLRGGLDRSIAEHRDIIEAARARDPERASVLMLQHIQVPQRRLLSLTEEEFARETHGAMETMAAGTLGGSNGVIG